MSPRRSDTRSLTCRMSIVAPACTGESANTATCGTGRVTDVLVSIHRQLTEGHGCDVVVPADVAVDVLTTVLDPTRRDLTSDAATRWASSVLASALEDAPEDRQLLADVLACRRIAEGV